MTFMRIFGRVLGMLGLAAVFAAQAAVTPPDALVKNTVDEVMGVIKQSKDKRTLHDLAEKKVLPHFDFTRMTMLAVGKRVSGFTAALRPDGRWRT